MFVQSRAEAESEGGGNGALLFKRKGWLTPLYDKRMNAQDENFLRLTSIGQLASQLGMNLVMLHRGWIQEDVERIYFTILTDD